MLPTKIYGVTCLEQVGASLEFMYPGENNEFQGRFQKYVPLRKAWREHFGFETKLASTQALEWAIPAKDFSRYFLRHWKNEGVKVI